MSLSSLQPPISKASSVLSTNPPLPRTVLTALRHGHFNEAVTLIRQEHNIGVGEATDLIESYLRSQPALKRHIDNTQADTREGLLRWLLFLLIGGIGLAYCLT